MGTDTEIGGGRRREEWERQFNCGAETFLRAAVGREDSMHPAYKVGPERENKPVGPLACCIQHMRSM